MSICLLLDLHDIFMFYKVNYSIFNAVAKKFLLKNDQS